MVDLSPILFAGFLTAPPIIFASLAQILCEKTGEYNIGIEGIMLVSATSTYMVGLLTKSLLVSILTGPCIGALFGIILGFLQIRLRWDQIVLGLGVILLGIGLDPYLASFLPEGMVGRPVATLPPLKLFFLSEIPSLAFVFGQNVLVYLSLLAIPITWIVMKKTFFGLKIAATGENPRGSDVVGIRVFRTKFIGLLISCTLGGLAGGYFIYGIAGSWIVGITGGTGFLSLAIVRIGNWNPLLVGVYSIFVSMLFGFQYLGQLAYGQVPPEFFMALTYILSIVVIVVVNHFTKEQGPRALGIPYKRE
jgi:simple sugar transport system permease protein